MYFSFTIFCKRKKWQSIPLIRLFLFCVSFFQYRILSPYASPQEFIEDSRKEVIATLQAAGYQLPSSENVAVKEWSGLLLKFILKADEINRHLCFWFFCTLCKKREENSRTPCAVKSQSGIIGRVAPFYSV